MWLALGSLQRRASGHPGHSSCSRPWAELQPGFGFAAPRSCSRCGLCQERELGLWDSGPFDVCCSQTIKVFLLSNVSVGSAVWLSACSGGSCFSVEDTYWGGVWFLPELRGFWCSGLCFEALNPFLNCFARWTPMGVGTGWERSEACRLWNLAVGSKPLLEWGRHPMSAEQGKQRLGGGKIFG